MPLKGLSLESRLRGHVEILAGLIGERNSNHASALDAARAYITQQLRHSNLDVVEQHYQTGMRLAVNLEVHLMGSKPSKACLVVGAHYDSAPGTPGADDNASAVAALIEIVRILASKKRRRSIRCVFFDCEEPPHFATKQMGSFQHAKLLSEQGEAVHGMVCLESLGYFPRKVDPKVYRPRFIYWLDRILGGRYVAIVSDFNSIPFGIPFVLRFVTSGFFRCVPAALPKSLGVADLSDNRSYWAHGFRAVMVTNTAMFRNPNYHTRNDLPKTLDYARCATVCRMLATAIRRTCA